MEQQNPTPEKTNKLPKWLTTVTPFSKALAMILFIALPFLGFYLGTKYQQQVTVSIPNISEVQKNTIRIPTTTLSNQCKVFSESQANELTYAKYVVMPGDTILSIAENQLGGSSRSADIVYANMNNYPGLSMQQPEIQPGWVLDLPRPFIKKIIISDQQYASYQLPTVLSRQITSTGAGTNWILTSGQGETDDITVPLDVPFYGKQRPQYKVGDCVTVVEAGSGGDIYAVFSQ